MRAFVLLGLLGATALALDLDSVHKSSYRGPVANGPREIGEKRRIHGYGYEQREEEVPKITTSQYYGLLAARMQDLLDNMLSTQGEQGMADMDPRYMELLKQLKIQQQSQMQAPYDQDDFPSSMLGSSVDAYGPYVSKGQPSASKVSLPVEDFFNGRQWTSQAALPRVPLRPEYAYDKRSSGYRSHKQLPSSIRIPQEEYIKKRSVEAKTTAVPTKITVTKPPVTQSPVLKESKKLKVVAPASRNKREMEAAKENKTQMSPSEFKQWLTDEYYRTMAMSFATMRKKRSIEEDSPVAPPAEGNREQSAAAFNKLKQMEHALLAEALSLIQQGGQPENRKLKNQVANRIDVAHDIESLKKMMQKLYQDSERLKVIEDQELVGLTGSQDTGKLDGEDGPLCPELDMLSSGCVALDGLFPPQPVEQQFLLSCNWHEVCYACGGEHGITADQCDQAFLNDMRQVCAQLGSCNKQMIQLLLEPLHKKRIYYKRSSPPVCQRPCVTAFLDRSRK